MISTQERAEDTGEVTHDGGIDSQHAEINEVVEGAGIVEYKHSDLGDRDHIPVPNIYFGPDSKRYKEPIFDKVPAFTQEWLLRIMYYRFYQYKYILKSDLNQCLHANLRRKNLTVNFGMKWIWVAVRAMIECDEDCEGYRLVEWVYEDDYSMKKRKRQQMEEHVQGGLPTKIRLTQYGRKIASQLGELSKKHNKMAKPPPDQRREDISESEEYTGNVGDSVQMLSPDHVANSIAEYDDLKSIFSTVEMLLAEVASLRKEKAHWMRSGGGGHVQAYETHIVPVPYNDLPVNPQDHHHHHHHIDHTQTHYDHSSGNGEDSEPLV